MRLLQSLRDAITAAIPALAQSPETLIVFAQKGHVRSAGAASLSFEYAYTGELIITDFTADLDLVVVALLSWCRINQPHLLDNPTDQDHGIRWNAELLNAETCDISIEIDITEPVIVRRNPAQYIQLDGSHTLDATWTLGPVADTSIASQRWTLTHPPSPARLGEELITTAVAVTNAAGEQLAAWVIPAPRF